MKKYFDIRLGNHLDEQVFISFCVKGWVSGEFTIDNPVGHCLETLHHFFTDTLDDLHRFSVLLSPMS